jgi:hypothetical protein
MGVIDTVSAGFRLVLKRPWLIVLPLLLDLFLWQGPKLSMSAVVDQWQTTLSSLSTDLAATGGAGSEAYTESLDALLDDTVRSTNLFGALVWTMLGVPNVTGSLPILPGDSPLQITTTWQLSLVQLAILATGLLLAALYLNLVASAVRDESPTLAGLAGATARTWTRLALVAVPVALAIISTLVVLTLLGILALVLAMGFLWILVCIAFVPQGIALGRQGAWGAVISSYLVVRTNLWPTLGLLILTNLLSSGLGLIWMRLAGPSTMGTLAAILLSATVGTSLTAAMFLFYRDRLAALQRAVATARSA